MIHAWFVLKRSYEILTRYQFDEAAYLSRLAITEAHQEYVRSQVDQLPDVDVADLVRLVEIDDAWIETHWLQKEIG